MVGILFDLDGTLLDTLEDLTDSVNFAMEQFGCPKRSISHVRSIVGNGALQLVALALPGTPEDPDPREVLQVYKKHYDAHCRCKTAPYPGIPEVLAEISKKHPVGIVSNKPDIAVRALCSDFFPGIYALGEAEGCPRKPAPHMLQKAMETMGVSSCIYIGDTEVDLLTAANTGIPCLCVTWGFRDEADLVTAGARYLCHRVCDLPDTIEKILKEENHGQ